MDNFIGFVLMMIVILSFAAKWMATSYAQSNPEDAEAIKKAASEKLVGAIKRRLK
jgi:hypothetical protein